MLNDGCNPSYLTNELKSPEGAKYIMRQSLVKNYIHIIFSTKHRIPMIDDEIESELFGYLWSLINGTFGIDNVVLSGLMQMIENSNVVLHPTFVNTALSELE